MVTLRVIFKCSGSNWVVIGVFFDYRIRISLLEALSSKPEISVMRYVKEIALRMGEECDPIKNLVYFFKREEQYELIMRIFLSESAEESTEVIVSISDRLNFILHVMTVVLNPSILCLICFHA